MARITRKDWNDLIELESVSLFSRKEALIKFSVSLCLISLYLAIAWFLNFNQDVTLGFPLLVINLAGISLVILSKTEKQIRWFTIMSLISFMGYFGYIAFELGTTRGLIFFLAPTVLYFFEIERLAWLRWQIPAFTLATLIPLSVIPYDLLMRLAIAFIFVFIGFVTYQGNKKRLELLLLKESEKGYDLFMRHTRLLEHNVINSVSKMVYVSEMLKELYESRPENSLKNQITILDEEIESITKVIMQTGRKDLSEFRI